MKTKYRIDDCEIYSYKEVEEFDFGTVICASAFGFILIGTIIQLAYGI